MSLTDDVYNKALDTFHRAVSAFADGDIQRGDELLAALDLDAIERDRQQLRQLARTSRAIKKVLPSHVVSRRIDPEVRRVVQQRDKYHCRFTARRLVDTQVFHEVSRISSVFHFDEHHSVTTAARGPAGHPMVRTHAAAYEHAIPLACGGSSTADNVIHTSVQLNESKGARILKQVPVPDDDWLGLVDYLPQLRQQRSSNVTKAGHAKLAAIKQHARSSSVTPSDRRGENTDDYRRAAEGLEITILALRDDPEAETTLKRLRKTNKNWFFTTRPSRGEWKIHRLYCSSLDFNGEQVLTLKPKICAEQRNVLHTWALRFGVRTTGCTRCRTPR
jgi:hypothetical protein